MVKGFHYALPEIAINGIEVFLRLYLILYYTQEIGLDPKLAGLALGIATFWDAITDPLVGIWSDRFRQKKGSRDILFLTGAFATALTLYGLFLPSAEGSTVSKFCFLLFGMMALNTGTTFFSVPYAALVGDFKLTDRERTQFIGWRLGMANLGALLGIAVPGYLAVQYQAKANFYSAQVLSMLVVITSVYTFWMISKWQRNEVPVQVPNFLNSWKSQMKSLKQSGLVLLILAFFVANIGLTLNSSLALLYYRERLLLPESQIQLVLILFFIIFSLSIPLWILIARGRSKIQTGSVGIFLLGVTNCIVYLVIPQQNLIATLLGASLLGGFFVGSYVLLESALAEITQKNDERTGKSSFGFYFGIWKMSGKISRGFALFLTGLLLSAVLDHGDAGIPKSDLLALFFGPGVGVFFILASLIAFRAKKQTLEPT